MVLTREALISVELPTAEVAMPEMGGGTIRLRGLNAGEMMEHYAAIKDEGVEKRAEALARLVVLSIIDEQGERVFAKEEWPLVLAWPNSALQRAARHAMLLNQPPESGDEEGDFHEGDDSSTD